MSRQGDDTRNAGSYAVDKDGHTAAALSDGIENGDARIHVTAYRVDTDIQVRVVLIQIHQFGYKVAATDLTVTAFVADFTVQQDNCRFGIQYVLENLHFFRSFPAKLSQIPYSGKKVCNRSIQV